MGARGPTPSVWPRKPSGIYHTTIDGNQVSLRTRNKREAEAELRRLLASSGRCVATGVRFTVRDLVEAYIADCGTRLEPDTVRGYRQHAASFVEKYGGMSATDVKVLHVNNWLNARRRRTGGKDDRATDDGIAGSTKYLAASVIKQAFEWGEYAGYIEANPIRRLKRHPMARRDPISVQDAERVMEHITPAILVALEALFVLGVRAMELCSMTVETIDLVGRKAVVKCKRTARNRKGVRTVYLSDVAVELLTPLVAKHRSGPIFFSTKSALTEQSLRQAVTRARRRACRKYGLPDKSLDHVKPHCFRGLYATEAMRRGVDAVLVAKALGQADTKVLMEHYASPDDDMLIDAVNRGARKPPSTPGTRRGTPG